MYNQLISNSSNLATMLRVNKYTNITPKETPYTIDQTKYPPRKFRWVGGNVHSLFFSVGGNVISQLVVTPPSL